MAMPDTFWLTLTNIVLGVLVVLGLAITALGTLCGNLARLKKRRSYGAELDHDMQVMFAAAHPSATALNTEASGAVQKLLEALCRGWHRLSKRRWRALRYGHRRAR